MPYDNIYRWELKYDINQPIYVKQTELTDETDLLSCQRGWGSGGG